MTGPRLVASTLFACLALGRAEVPADDHPPDVRVMSFNIRFGTADDGENRWDLRKAFLVETIRADDPDLLGTQETLGFQRDYLAENLPGHEWVGVGRDDGADRGEMMALYYQRDRFERLDAGHFWLSETPERPGSKSWDSSLPRMTTWVKLRDRRDADAPPILFLNTHFDHRGPVSRAEAARLIRDRAASLGEGCSIILTGDFNSGEGSIPYRALFDVVEAGRESPVIDTYRRAHPEPGPDDGTSSGFGARPPGGPRIDWIGASRDWEVIDAGIDHTRRDGRTPSDHYPVTAVLRRPAASADSDTRSH